MRIDQNNMQSKKYIFIILKITVCNYAINLYRSQNIISVKTFVYNCMKKKGKIDSKIEIA